MAAAAGLNGRARNRAVGAEHAAVAGLGSEHLVTLFAFVKPLARIGGHGFVFMVPATGAGEGREQVDHAHGWRSAKVEGYPALAVTPIRASTWVSALSNVTSTSFRSKFT